ncbi:MAG: phosphoribosylformylglycinamidine synthase I [Candidatus Omnitrophica bacterium]|nr:phosphoribosylformylglycinamidine synthase I [Candidatus Omnitrophota bacterium]
MSEKKSPRVLVLRTAGTNCDEETAFAFRSFGAKADLVHINRLFEGTARLSDYHILAIPGGFTYGDDIVSGRILANELRLRLGDDIQDFIKARKLIIGICNGFQALVRSGILPGDLGVKSQGEASFQQTVTLTYNESGKFEDRWTYLRLSGKSVWTKGLEDVIYIPVAHAEGKFVPRDDKLLNKLKKNGQVAFRYCDEQGNPAAYPGNPNGSIDDIAGITDKTGRVLGLMPHPERHFIFEHHPRWTRFEKKESFGQGAQIFKNGVQYVKEKLLA